MFPNYNNKRRRKLKKHCFCAFVIVAALCLFYCFNTGKDDYASYALPASAWGLSFQSDYTVPVPNISAEELSNYNAYFYNPNADKKIYLTFDCGYENGNTQSILDTLKKHDATATFFVVGPYINENTSLLLRMVNEGHAVGNHTYSHPDVSEMPIEELSEELKKLEDAFFNATGSELDKYFRPPEGKLSDESLQNAKDLGYSTIFWSLAYKDWLQDAQPTKQEAFSKILPRLHDGAILLLHNTSATNAQILDELLSEIKQMGYNFGSLSDFTSTT